MKISITTPSYNQADYIEQTIRSICSQKGDFELEYFIMDGGSTDNTVEVIKKLEKEYQDSPVNFNWVSEKDKGQSDAINKGWSRSTGDIIAWLNSDDFYEPNTFQIVSDFFRQNPDVMWIYGKCPIIDTNNKLIRRPIALYRHLLGKNYSYAKLLAENFVAQPTVFIRKKVIDEFGLIDVDDYRVMDYEFWLRIGKKYPGKFINKNLARFRLHDQSKSGTGFVEHIFLI